MKWRAILAGLLAFISSGAVAQQLPAPFFIEVAGPSQHLFENPYYSCLSNLYVATTGSDTTGNGTSGNPWATIQKANDSVPAAGTCINVAPGLYLTGGIILNHGGSSAVAGGYVTYRSTTMGAAHIKTTNPDGNGNGTIVGFTAPYLMFDGFEIDGGTNGVNVCAAVGIDTGSPAVHHVWLMNSTIHGAGLSGVQFNGQGDPNGEWFWILHNNVYNNSSSTVSGFFGSGISVYEPTVLPSYTPTAMDNRWAPYHIVINYNVSHDNFNVQSGTANSDGNGIILDDWQHAQNPGFPNYISGGLVLGNVTYHNGGKGIHVFGSDNSTVANNTAYNNNWDTHNTATFRGEIFTQGTQGNTFVNNIAWTVVGAGILADNNPFFDRDGTGTPNVWSNNIAFGTGGTGWATGGAFGSPNTFSCTMNQCNSDPLWVNKDGNNFALLAGSPAIGYGVALPDRTFTALHVYYVNPTSGSDGAAGTSPATAWKTLNHAGIVCGDVVLAAPGTHANGFGFGQWGTVTGCPSTSGGIDGAGGINFAIILCAGPDVMSCKIDATILPYYDPFRVTAAHWAIEGFWATQPSPTYPGSGQQTVCFGGDNQGSPGGTPMPYIAFINDIASFCNLSGFSTGGGGCAPSGTVGCSFDYIALIGSLSFNGANSRTGNGSGNFCGSGVSLFPGTPFATTDTHIYISQYFGAYNTNSGTPYPGTECDAAFTNGSSNHPHTDGEGLIFDTYATGYAIEGSWNKTAVLENAAIWHSGNACVEVFPQGNGSTDDQGQYYVFNVTCYSNSMDPRAGCGGELWYNGTYPTGSAFYQAKNNIFFLTQSSCGNAGNAFMAAAVSLDGNPAHTVKFDDTKIDISSNWIFQTTLAVTVPPGVPGTYVVDNRIDLTFPTPLCDGGNPVPCFNAPWHFGTNTYGDPGMGNPAALFSTSPDCTGFISVVDCMNAGFGVYAKIKPTIAPTTMGYQPPGPCLRNTSDPQYVRFPQWLKGIVYLHSVDGFVSNPRIVQKSGLVTKPCIM